ncbi:MAG TPA: hypothetical protein VE218_01550, partial [Acidobacteriaceae bacterium]|nr:hypothetical protein [Acidobacteriaceae bacterium]
MPSRHLDEKQKGNYDSTLWHLWMLHMNLSTIHLITRLTNRNARRAASAALGTLTARRVIAAE